MKIILINGSAVPLYEQIKNEVKENILKNKVEEGEQLPSVRTLSKDLKVSILTVKKLTMNWKKRALLNQDRDLAPLSQEKTLK